MNIITIIFFISESSYACYDKKIESTVFQTLSTEMGNFF